MPYYNGGYKDYPDTSTPITAAALNFAEAPKILGGGLLINSSFAINQRGVTGTVVLLAGEYGHDRFRAGSGGCTYTFAIVENLITITITAGTLEQEIEGINFQSGEHILSWSGTAQGRIDGGSYGASGITATLTGGTNAIVEFDTGTLTTPKFEVGEVATPFIPKTYAEELQECRSYAGEVGIPLQPFIADTNQGCLTIPLETPLRALPTLVAKTDIYLHDSAGNAILAFASGATIPYSVVADFKCNTLNVIINTTGLVSGTIYQPNISSIGTNKISQMCLAFYECEL